MLNISSHEFGSRLDMAKKASLESPVIVTEEGLPKHVLLSFDEFHKITSLLNLRYSNQVPNTDEPSVAELLSLDDSQDIEIDDSTFDNILQKANISLKPADFS